MGMVRIFVRNMLLLKKITRSILDNDTIIGIILLGVIPAVFLALNYGGVIKDVPSIIDQFVVGVLLILFAAGVGLISHGWIQHMRKKEPAIESIISVANRSKPPEHMTDIFCNDCNKWYPQEGYVPHNVSPQHKDDTEKIPNVTAYIFFPSGTPRENQTLEYHLNNRLSHKLIVNHKVTPPNAYYLTPDSYGWKMIVKFPTTWVSEDDPTPYDRDFLKRWCDGRNFKLYTFPAEKKHLLESSNFDDSYLPHIFVKKTRDGQQVDPKTGEQWYVCTKCGHESLDSKRKDDARIIPCGKELPTL